MRVKSMSHKISRVRGSKSFVLRVRLALVILLTSHLFLAGCASTGGVNADLDPYENINRKVYGFNEAVDDYVAEPLTDIYRILTPPIFRTGVSNFFINLGNINVLLNDFLQGKFKQGFADTSRFVVNSTIGIGGLFDVAKKFGLKQNQEDFGQTLGVWGVGQGPYLVLPFLGPNTLRSTPNIGFEIFTNPVITVFPVLAGLEAVDERLRADGSLQFINNTALDPYVFTRDAYLQWQNFLVHDGNPPLPDFDEEFDEDFDDISLDNR